MYIFCMSFCLALFSNVMLLAHICAKYVIYNSSMVMPFCLLSFDLYDVSVGCKLTTSKIYVTRHMYLSDD